MITRILSAVILIPLALLIVVYASPVYFLIGIGFIGTLCLYEYFGLMRALEIRTRPWVCYCSFWVLLFILSRKTIPIVPVLALGGMAMYISALWRKSLPVRDRAFGLMAELFGIGTIAFFLYPALLIRYEFGREPGLQWTILMLLITWGGDTFALLTGRNIGKTHFAPVLSPKKTVEGSIGGLIAGTAIAAAVQHFFYTDLPLGHVIAVSVILGIFGQLGDLAESMIKRAGGVKDSSHLIPGHGGVLDRMDSLLFSIPVLYGYLLLLYR